jgi:hypothetical protein
MIVFSKRLSLKIPISWNLEFFLNSNLSHLYLNGRSKSDIKQYYEQKPKKERK